MDLLTLSQRIADAAPPERHDAGTSRSLLVQITVAEARDLVERVQSLIAAALTLADDARSYALHGPDAHVGFAGVLDAGDAVLAAIAALTGEV